MNTDKARAVLPWCGVSDRSADGLATVVHVPSSPTYEAGRRSPPRCCCVTLARGRDSLTLDCHSRQIDGQGQSGPCKAQDGGYICYHALAAVLVVAGEGRGKVLFFPREQDAITNASTTGRMVRLVQGRATAYAVFHRLHSSPVARPAPIVQVDEKQAEMARELESLRAQLAEWKRADEEPKCGRCKSAVLTTADEKEKGLCPGCDRSVDIRPTVAVVKKGRKK